MTVIVQGGAKGQKQLGHTPAIPDPNRISSRINNLLRFSICVDQKSESLVYDSTHTNLLDRS